MVQFSWTEKVTADVAEDRLCELFQQHHAGKAAELLAAYMVDNPDETEVMEILAIIRAEDKTVDVTYEDIEHDA